jgi:ATP-dependent exoDNAse (exonuclease V) alpha subunit
VLVLDEASQLSTADLAMIGEAARQAGARIIATGDTAQLGAVEVGGMFRLLAGSNAEATEFCLVGRQGSNPEPMG